MNNAKPRPALGQVAQIGTLYDAVNDSFLSSIFGSRQVPNDALVCNPAAATTTIQTVSTDDYKDKFSLLGVSPDLGASILGGLLEIQASDGTGSGSGAYLARRRATDGVAQAALMHRLLTVRERVDRRSRGLRSSVDLHALQGTRATHVVVTIDYGVETVVEINHRLDGDRTNQATAMVEALKISLEDTSANGFHPHLQSSPATLDISVFSDVLPAPANVHSVQEAAELLRRQLPQALHQVNMGKGKPVTYRLLPLAMFMSLIQDDDDDDDDNDDTPPVGAVVIQISPEHLDKFCIAFEKLLAAHRRLTDYSGFLSMNRQYVSPDHVDAVRRRAGDLQQAIVQLKASYGQALRDVRTGHRPASVLQDLHQSVAAEDGPVQAGDIFDQERQKVEFVARAVNGGATYIGHDRRASLAGLLERQAREGYAIYVLSFSHSTMRDDSWPANRALFFELLDTEHRAGAPVAIEDCDATRRPLEAARIAEYQNGFEVTADLLDRRKFLAGKCFAQCKDHSLKTQDVQKPVRRRFVKIPCPGPRCDASTAASWMCPRCFHPLEYGYSDKYIYCDCGRGHFRDFAFKCNNAASHGPGYIPYRDESQLQALLQRLASSDYVNILVLGETGVGKSTFINAFVNYLTFESLDDALKSDELHWVIPCSFSTQVMDRSRPDGKIIQHKIIVGDRDDEHDGSKGDSATQQTSVYPINIGSKTIRLIDTPGIGDTRGVQFDKKNMADILATLNSYDELHGILILLKSNSSRLTIVFEFCIKELLTHLHRSAVNNIAFGFTNTRISNYTPGDTFGPLETLLAQQSNVQLSLSMRTSYCFDSESFRYLAAYKQGVMMENEEDFRRSWKHSRDESQRVVDYFQSKPPHSVTSTISLNGTRQLILELTKPLADISQLIRKNIALCQDREKELADTRLTGEALRKKLQFEKVQLREKNLGMPRTVCSDRNCIEMKDDGAGKRVTEYKSHCHQECYLSDVPAEVLGFPGLIHCWAFSGNDHCQTCRHHWRMHLHIMYEFEEFTATMTDVSIEKDLAANASDTTLRQHGLQEAQQLINEYEYEHAQVQNAAAHFGLYLKKNSITAYNDVTLDYLDMLIKQEQEKIEVGGDRKRMNALIMDRRRHEELVAALTARMQRPTGASGAYTVLDEAGVDAVVRKLYGLKHFGEQLKTVKNTISAAHKATYRERPYRVGPHKHHASTRSGGSGGGVVGGVGEIINTFSSMIGLSSTPLPSPPSPRGGVQHSISSKSSHSHPHRRASQSYNASSSSRSSASPNGYAGASSPGGGHDGSPMSQGAVSRSSGGNNRSSMLWRPGQQPSPPPQDPPPPYIPVAGEASNGSTQLGDSWWPS